jgi:hypothetical protein
MPTSRSDHQAASSSVGRSRRKSRPASDSARGPDGLAAELDRQHSLVEMLAGRLRESADALDEGRPLDPDRIRRAIRVHRGFLIEFHIPCDLAVAAELATIRAPRLSRLLRECAAEPKRAADFQRAALALVGGPRARDSIGSHAMGFLVRAEADRIEAHHSDDAAVIGPGIATWIPFARRRALFTQIRRRYREHVKDEAALVAWASQNHPSAD